MSLTTLEVLEEVYEFIEEHATDRASTDACVEQALVRLLYPKMKSWAEITDDARPELYEKFQAHPAYQALLKAMKGRGFPSLNLWYYHDIELRTKADRLAWVFDAIQGQANKGYS